MSDNGELYDVPELKDCEHGVRNPEVDCVMCVEEKKAVDKKKEEKKDADA